MLQEVPLWFSTITASKVRAKATREGECTIVLIVVAETAPAFDTSPSGLVAVAVTDVSHESLV